MDDDANIGSPLDTIVHAEDQFVVGEEGYDYDDRCYVANYSISEPGFLRRFGDDGKKILFGEGKFFLNWAMFSAPGHPIIKRVLEHAVQLIKAEYICVPLVKMHKHDHRGKLLQCATTFPITYVARELVLENQNKTDMGLRVIANGMKEYGADIKAWYNDYLPNHWVKMVQKHKAPYLREYRPQFITDIKNLHYEMHLYQAHGDRQVYVIMNGTRRAVPSMAAFFTLKLDFENVEFVDRGVLDQIPLGPDIPDVK
jgi:hypothetical protein